MREILPELLRRWQACESIGMGTVVETFNSAPRLAGASMFVTPDGDAVGSVSGEGALQTLHRRSWNRESPVLQRYGVADNDAFALGLTCGGILEFTSSR